MKTFGFIAVVVLPITICASMLGYIFFTIVVRWFI